MYNNGRYYGNSSMGMSFSPDRSRDVSYNNLNSQFLGASGSRQGGYYYSASNSRVDKSNTSGWYDGAGRYHHA